MIKNEITKPELDERYSRLIETILPELSPAERLARIRAAEQTTGFDFSSSRVPAGVQFSRGSAILNPEYWSMLSEAGALSAEQKAALLQFLDDVKTINSITRYPFEDEMMTRTNVVILLNNCGLRNVQEAADIMMHGPVVSGFSKSADPAIPDEKIRAWLLENFGHEELRRLKLVSILKSENFIFRIPQNAAIREELEQLRKLGQIYISDSLPSTFYCRDETTYLKVVMLMEGVTSVDKLSHLYKFRSDASWKDVRPMVVYRFGVEDVNKLDYLRGLDISAEDKMRLYMVGTIAHEIAHKVMQSLHGYDLATKGLTGYVEIVEEEYALGREKYVSNYAALHETFFKAPLFSCIDEDLAETVRIYATNPDWLKENYPRRFEFVKEYLPNLLPGSIPHTIL